MQVLPSREGPRDLRVTKCSPHVVTVMLRDPFETQRTQVLRQFHYAAVTNPIASLQDGHAFPRRNESVDGSPSLMPGKRLFGRNRKIDLFLECCDHGSLRKRLILL